MQLLQQEVTPVTFQRDVLQLAAHKYSGEGVFNRSSWSLKEPTDCVWYRNDIVLPNGM